MLRVLPVLQVHKHLGPPKDPLLRQKSQTVPTMDVLSESEVQAGKQVIPARAADAGPPPAMAFGAQHAPLLLPSSLRSAVHSLCCPYVTDPQMCYQDNSLYFVGNPSSS